MKTLLTLLLLITSGMVSANEYLSYVAVNPCRIVDTRKNMGAIEAEHFLNFKAWGSEGELAWQGGNGCPNPMAGVKPKAVSAYVLVVPDKGTAGVATAYPSDKLPPPVGAGSTVNFGQGRVTGNTTNITLCEEGFCPADGEFAVLARSTGFNLVVDVQGYFYPTPTDLDPEPTERWVDNGDGTISDHETGLMWEETAIRTSDMWDNYCHGVHCMYTWGETSVFLQLVNNERTDDPDAICFANYCDWRIPKLSELSGILNETEPYIDPVFGLIPDYNYLGKKKYWTSTIRYGESPNEENLPWVVSFLDGTISYPVNQEYWNLIRLVRTAR